MFEIYIYEDFYSHICGQKIYISPNLIKQIGRCEWYDLLHEFVGALVINKRKGIAVDTFYMELIEMFPWIFSEEIANEADQLEKILDTYRKARNEKIKAGGSKDENYCNYQHERRLCKDHDNGKYGTHISNGI